MSHSWAQAPQPIGNYKTFKISGKHVYINQIALKNGKIKNAGTIGKEVSLKEAQEATRQTARNILAVLKEAVGGDLSRVKQAVQLTGYFTTSESFRDHSTLMNEASGVMIEVLGQRGEHARAAIGSSSLPLGSPVEIAAIFELN
jgi:NAD(P)H dehydrogenase (quinone)